MEIKKTKLLVAELRVIADSFPSKYCREILKESAQRLEDTDKIATYYRNKTEMIGGKRNGRNRREKRRTHV